MVELQDVVPEMWGSNGDSQTRSTPKFPEGPGDTLTRGVSACPCWQRRH